MSLLGSEPCSCPLPSVRVTFLLQTPPHHLTTGTAYCPCQGTGRPDAHTTAVYVYEQSLIYQLTAHGTVQLLIRDVLTRLDDRHL